VLGIAVSSSVKALLLSIVVAAGEIGDKAQIATVMPAAKFNDPVAVIASGYPLTAPRPRIILPV
jgi:putative Ca2+/H+ antiporter (TMEM165/GDT1 family)